MATKKTTNKSPEQAPLDFNLDIPDLKIEELNIEVEKLKANISVNAEVKNIVSISVGTSVELDGLKLDLKGVDAKAKLEVFLGNIKEIIVKACDTAIEEVNIEKQSGTIIDTLNPLK